VLTFYFQLFLSIILDVLFGDPHWYPHPVRVIGKVCSWGEKITREITQNQYFAGLLTVFIVLLCTGICVYFALFAGYSLSYTFGNIIAVVLLYTTIAGRDLLRHSNAVYEKLENDNSLESARLEVGKIVGRDTGQLDHEGISKACVETVAENMVDGVTAPLFFAIIASLVGPFTELTTIGCAVIGAFLYKAVNTMDSMIGYKNEKYLHFGRSAAKLDDVINFIPARISGLCLIIAAFLLKLDYRRAARIFFRDRLMHSSPNAGHSEAAVAGSLGIRLGGPSNYFGKVVDKPYMGDGERKLVPGDIKKTNILVIIGSFIFVTIMICFRSLFPF